MISTSFVLLMMLIGGVIGFLADSWGHKIGKKRLSFLGLRPRYTATLVTVGAGVLIPLVTVVLVSAVSEGVRRWLLEGQRAIEQSRELQQSVLELQQKSRDLSGEVERKATQQKELDAKLKLTEGRVREFKERADKYMAQAAEAAAKANRLTVRLSEITRQLVERQRELRTAKVDLEKQMKALHASKRDFVEANRQLQASYDENNRLLRENGQLEKDLEDLRKDIESLKEQKRVADESLQDADERLSTTQSKLEEVTTDLQKTSLQLGLKATELLKAKNDVEGYKLITNRSRFARIIFNVGDELARIPIPPRSSVVDASLCIDSLLRSARVEAKKRGAERSDDLEEAGLFPEGNTTVNQLRTQIALELAGKDDYTVLIAYARGNAFKGEPVPVNLKGYPNPLVYRAGHRIRETEIDGRLSETEVVAAISEFIRNDVVPQALRDKMIPVEGREDSLGSVDMNEILALVKQIRERGKRARIRAEAAEDTRSADILKLKLSVR